MKKAIKGISEVAGMSLAIVGLIVCACETESMDQQIMNACIGFGMMVAGAVFTVIANRGEEDELS